MFQQYQLVEMPSPVPRAESQTEYHESHVSSCSCSTSLFFVMLWVVDTGSDVETSTPLEESYILLYDN